MTSSRDGNWKKGASMTNNQKTAWLAAVALVFMLITTGHAAAKSSKLANPPQDASAISRIQAVAYGQQMKITGIVLKRNADSFTMRDQAGAEWEAALTPKTSVKTNKKGVFRGGKAYGVSYILRGLRLEVKGAGNAEGQLVADSIRFDEDDLRTAQALQARVHPVDAPAARHRKPVAPAER